MCVTVNTMCRGTFLLEREDKSTFEVRVPPFTLDSQEECSNPSQPAN